MPEAPDIIKELVDRYDSNRDQYLSNMYNEEQTRAEFINPFFEALGWDVANKNGYSPAYMDVVFEGTIRIDGQANAPDYTFRIGQTRKFVVEAKKPAIRLKFDPAPALQIRRYSWSAKLPLGILTNFHELAVYDCRIQTKATDKVDYARLKYLTYKDYVSQWDEISGTFSREAVWKGAFDHYAQSEPRKTGTAQVDEQFLKQIEEWRSMLAQNLALRNPGLGVRELNYAVQSTIDRIVFLRICEDRGIENQGQLLSYTNGKNVHDRMLNLYYNADDKYNSGLFHFRDEKNRVESPDRFTPGLKIDDKILKEIITGLYPPKSPYDFFMIGADILGNVYEQFLGKVISLSPAHKAQVEEKPEVKKAGGVYYTPAYIVDYIVQNTVGKLCEGKTPKQVEKLRILDPACGSGSFLINAYTWLLNWHLDYYVKDGPDKHRKEVYQAAGGALRLSTKEKKRILLNNIYGVDIDSQAVEVTKLSLLLKVLEGENAESIDTTMKVFHERALPDLTNNIKCGNSLIGTDFDTAGLSDDEIRRINPFDWDKEFSDIMKKGGFDAVIGNPPYIRIQTMKEWAPIEVEHYKRAFASAAKGNYDIYVVFVEKGLSLLNKNGLLGFILPHKFFNAKYGEGLRKVISEGKHLSEIVHFGDQQIFGNATTYTNLLFLNKGGCREFVFTKVIDLEAWRNSFTGTVEGVISNNTVTSTDWNFTVGAGTALFDKLSSMPVKLENVTSRIFQGIKTSADKIYIVDMVTCEDNRINVYSHEKDAHYWIEPDLLHPLVKGGDIRHYDLLPTKRLILFPYIEDANGEVKLITEQVLKSEYPLTWSYLNANKSYLECREDGKMRGAYWYAYGRSQALDVMHLPKIITPDIAMHSSYCLDDSGESFFTGGVAGGYGILVSSEYSREYILGLLNSKLLEWYIRQTATTMRGGYFSYESRFIRNLPIQTLDSIAKSQHDKMVELVDRMLDLHKKLGAATIPGDRTQIERQIATTDREIDKLVYELYGLTEDEIKIVEESVSAGK